MRGLVRAWRDWREERKRWRDAPGIVCEALRAAGYPLAVRVYREHAYEGGGKVLCVLAERPIGAQPEARYARDLARALYRQRGALPRLSVGCINVGEPMRYDAHAMLIARYEPSSRA